MPGRTGIGHAKEDFFEKVFVLGRSGTIGLWLRRTLQRIVL